MAFTRGEPFSREVGQRIHASVATTTALAAIPVEDRVDGQLCLVTDEDKLYRYSLTASMTASADVIAPATGAGRWLAVGATGGSKPPIVVVNRTSGALGAYTRTGNVILANANGAIGAIDGVTNVAGQLLFVHPDDAAAIADAGVYMIDSVGAAGAKYQLTRATAADTGAEFGPNAVVICSQGTMYADTAWQVTNNAVTLNTTGITMAQVPFGFGAAGAMVAETPDVAASAGTSALAARIDHVHACECGAPIAQTTTTAALAEGNATTFARSNHAHTLTLTSGTQGARPAAALAGLTYNQTDIAPGLYRDDGAAWTRIATLIDYVETTITSDDLTTAGVGPESENVGLAALPAGAVILGYGINLTDAFDNAGGVSLMMELGYDGDVDALEDGFNCYTASPNEAAGWTFTTHGPGVGCPCIVGSTRQLLATFTAGGDQLVNFTNGSVTVRVYYIQL